MALGNKKKINMLKMKSKLFKKLLTEGVRLLNDDTINQFHLERDEMLFEHKEFHFFLDVKKKKNSGITEDKSKQWSGQDLNPGHPHSNSAP